MSPQKAIDLSAGDSPPVDLSAGDEPPSSPAPISDTRPDWQKRGQAAVEDFLRAAGLPESPRQIPEAIGGMLAPKGDPQHPTTGERIPLLGPILTAQQKTLDQPGAWAKIYGSIPLIGPVAYEGSKALEEGKYASTLGSLVNIALQALGARGEPAVPGSAEASLKAAGGDLAVSHVPGQAVKPGVKVTNKPGAVGSVLASKFNLRPDYAKKIAEKTQEITDTQKEAQRATQSAQTAAEQEAAKIQGSAQFTRHIIDQVRDKTIQDLEGQLGSLEQQRHSVGSQLIADTAKAAHEEYQRVSQPFIEIGKQIQGNVSNAQAIQSIIESAVVDEGGRIPEIPPGAFRALPAKAEPIAASPTGAIIAPAGSGLGGLAPKAVTFDTLTRVKEDLFSTASASKDTAIRRGLYKAAEKVSELQQKIAADNGLGEKYKAAKVEYMKFRRGIGSPKAEKLLAARDVFDQAIDPKLQKIAGKSTAEGINVILKSVGVSPAELEAINAKSAGIAEQLKAIPKEAQAESKAISSAEKERLSAISKAAREAQSESEKEAAGKISEAQKYGGQVIKGKTTGELAGIDNVTLNRMKLEMEAKGIANPFALFQILYGLSIMAHSPLYGALHVGYGVGRSMPLEVLMNDVRFQNWVLEKSGVIPKSSADTALRKGLEQWGKTLVPAASRQALAPRSQSPAVPAVSAPLAPRQNETDAWQTPLP